VSFDVNMISSPVKPHFSAKINSAARIEMEITMILEFGIRVYVSLTKYPMNCSLHHNLPLSEV
jgi:hypothetical protein